MTTTTTLLDHRPTAPASRPARGDDAFAPAPHTGDRGHWLYRVHEGSLTPVPWQAQCLEHHLACSLEAPAPDRRACLPRSRGSRAVGHSWLITDTSSHWRQHSALELVLLALPGPDPAPDSSWAGACEPVRLAARLRHERQVGQGPVAFVQGLEWCPPTAVAFLTRAVMVVVNMGETAFPLPPKAQVLVSSAELEGSQDEPGVPPLSCVWLEPQSVACCPNAAQLSL